MSIVEVSGDILADPSELLVVPVNCVGVMGAGLAKAFRLRYPDSYQQYRQLCLDGQVRPGLVPIVDTGADAPSLAAMFPTKDHWRRPSEMVWVERGLEALVAAVADRWVLSVAVPALGCGLGGLDYEPVRARIIAALAPTCAQVRIYKPV